MSLSSFRLTRTGNVPLEFEGELLAEQAGKWHRGKERARHFDLRLYKTKGGKYVVERVYKTYWKGETHYEEAKALTTLEEVAEFLSKWDPAEVPGLGYPPGEQFKEKQTYLLSTLRQMYQDRVSTLLADFPVAERVD